MAGKLYTLPDMLAEPYRRDGVVVYEHVARQLSPRYMLAFSQPCLVVGLRGTRQLSHPASTELAGPASLVLHPQGHVVSVAVQESSFRCLMAFVPPNLLVSLVARHAGEGPSSRYASRLIGTHDRLLCVAESMAADIGAFGPAPAGVDLARFEYLLELIVLLGHAPALRAWSAIAADPPAVRVTRVVEAHWQERLSLAELAFLSGMSLSAFKRAFQRSYGMPPGQWLLERRMAHAAHLLAVEGMRPSQIWERLGFSTHSVFSQAFRRHFKMTPADYRSWQQRPSGDNFRPTRHTTLNAGMR